MRHNKFAGHRFLILNVFFVALRNEVDGPAQAFQPRLQALA
jgi:hypothetical protein